MQPALWWEPPPSTRWYKQSIISTESRISPSWCKKGISSRQMSHQFNPFDILLVGFEKENPDVHSLEQQKHTPKIQWFIIFYHHGPHENCNPGVFLDKHTLLWFSPVDMNLKQPAPDRGISRRKLCSPDSRIGPPKKAADRFFQNGHHARHSPFFSMTEALKLGLYR